MSWIGPSGIGGVLSPGDRENAREAQSAARSDANRLVPSSQSDQPGR